MKYLIPVIVLAFLVIAATSVGDVREEIRDYQKRGACFKADLDFNGKVDLVDLRLIAGDGDSGLGGFYAYSVPPAPFWFDQDKDGLISILDISVVARKNGQRC